jgi:hypothetical protein
MIFWFVTPCTWEAVHRSFGGTYDLHLQDRRISEARNQQEADTKARFTLLAACFLLVSFLTYSSILKIPATRPSDKSADCYLTPRRYKPEDCAFHSHRCESFISNIRWILDFRRCGYESSIFWDITPLRALLAACFMLLSCLA